MKKIYSLLIAVILVNVTSTAQEQVFNTSSDGSIIVKSKFIDEFDNWPYENTTPYILKFSETIGIIPQFTINKDLTLQKNTINKSDLNNSIALKMRYTIKGLRYKCWTDADPGDFNVIEILFNNDTILTLKFDNGWDNMSTDYGSYTSKFCGIEKLGDNTYAAIFKGIDIMSQPPYLTIVVMKGGKASLVFNKPMIVNSIKTNSDGTKTFDLQENTVEWIDENTPANSPITHTMTIKDGNIYFK